MAEKIHVPFYLCLKHRVQTIFGDPNELWFCWLENTHYFFCKGTGASVMQNMEELRCFIQYFARNRPWYSLRGLHIRITWFSLYGIRIPLFSLYGIHMPLLLYMAIQPIVLGMALLWATMTLHCHKDHYCDVTMIWPLWFHGIHADVSEAPDNALTTGMHSDHRLSIDRFFVGFNAICYPFLANNPIYIERCNCRLSTVPGFMQ